VKVHEPTLSLHQLTFGVNAQELFLLEGELELMDQHLCGMFFIHSPCSRRDSGWRNLGGRGLSQSTLVLVVIVRGFLIIMAIIPDAIPKA
jgi:hypothetical protein